MPRTDHAWTSSAQKPWTGDDQPLHEEIANSQITRWTPAQIKAAEKAGYFKALTAKCQKNLRLGLLDELASNYEDVE